MQKWGTDAQAKIQRSSAVWLDLASGDPDHWAVMAGSVEMDRAAPKIHPMSVESRLNQEDAMSDITIKQLRNISRQLIENVVPREAAEPIVPAYFMRGHADAIDPGKLTQMMQGESPDLTGEEIKRLTNILFPESATWVDPKPIDIMAETRKMLR